MTPANVFHSRNSSVYPGEYEPPPWTGKERIAAYKRQHVYSVKARVHLQESGNLFKLEIAAPGFSREDFFVHTARGRLFIIASSHERSVDNEDQGRQSTPFRYLEKEVVLPRNLDTNFVTAEYKEGTLFLCFSKSDFPVKAGNNVIIVY